MKYSRKINNLEENNHEESDLENELNYDNSSSNCNDNSEEEIGFSNDEEIVPNENNFNYTPTLIEKTDFNNLLQNIRLSTCDLNQKLHSIIDSFKTPEKNETIYGISYLDSKNNMMLLYISNLILYFLKKINGNLINQNSTTFKQLIQIKTFLERSKIIDLKLKSQIDQLIKRGEKDLTVDNDSNNFEKNNFRSRILDKDDENKEEDIDNDNHNDDIKKKRKYKIQKNLQEFLESTNETKIRKKKQEKIKLKIKNSEMYKDMSENFNENPKEINNYDTELNNVMRKVEEYEQDHFTRIKIPKKEMKRLRNLERKENEFDQIGKEFRNIEYFLNQDKTTEKSDSIKFLNKKTKNNMKNKKFKR